MFSQDKSTELISSQPKRSDLTNKESKTGISGKVITGEVQIFESGQLALSAIRARDGEQPIKILIRGLVNDVFSFYGKEAPEIAYRVIYESVMNDFYFMKPADIELCFQRGMGSKYGKVDYFHAGTLTNWLNLYFEERTQIAEQYSEEKAQPLTIQEWKVIKPEISESILQLAERIKPPSIKKYGSVQEYLYDIYREKTEDEITIAHCVEIEMDNMIESFKVDYENPLFPHEAEQSFEDYVKSRTEEEILKINLNAK